MRVVVVGAGLAGLTATAVLRAAGCEVTLVEAGPRPGGRARTVTAPFANGQYAESGGEWVDTCHHRMLGLLDHYGLERLGDGEQWTTIRHWLFREGRLFSPADLVEIEPRLNEELAEFDRIVESAMAGIADPGRPQDHPEAAAVDSQSLADVAERAGLGELALFFKRRNAQGEFAAEPEQVSLLFVAQQRANAARQSGGGEVRAHRVAGGLRQLTTAMAAEQAEVLSLDERLLAVDQRADHATVRTTRRSMTADFVVLTCALPPLRSVHFTPELPRPLHDAVHELGYGTVTKTAVQFPRRSWPAGYATTAGPLQRVYEPTRDQAGDSGILMSYCGGDSGHEWARLTERERIERAREEFGAMYAIDDDAVAGFSRAWSTEPRFGGSYAVYQPGQVTRFWEVLRHPFGRVWLAGEHVATTTGYLEGAVESGQAAAQAILSQ